MTPEDRVTLAGELALGLLDSEERAAALRLVLSDPAFARDVETWRRHFATLFAEWPEADAAPALEDRILRVETAAPVAAAAAVAPSRWRWVATAAAAIAACLLVALLLRPERIVVSPASPPATVAPLVAAIAPTGEGKPFGALYDAAAGEVRLAGAPTVPSDRSAQLWTIGGDGVPRPLGLLGSGTTSRIAIASVDRARLTAGTTLAISIEPRGGSPTGLPTGPVVATGVLTRA